MADMTACLSALFLTDPVDDRATLVQAKGLRVDGTCEWIKTNALYNSWLSSDSQLLWLSGGPGKGKTMLSIFLIEELERTMQLSQNTLVLQYFCDNKDEKRNTAVTIVRGLVYQLLRSLPKLINHILPSFKIQKESLFATSSLQTLWRIFENMLRDPALSTIYCVLDGLDECDEGSLEVLLGKFATLLSTSSRSSTCHLKLIVVSRDLPDFIPEVLSGFPRIRLDPDADTEVNNDIHRFINVKVDDLSAYRQYPESLHVHVRETFQNRAQGTFLWVGIVARALRKYKATEVEIALNLFPSGLEELYARMLLQIEHNRQETAAKILRWVVMAVRPLTVSELSAAIETTVKPSVATFSCDEVTRDQVLYCGYLLTIKEDKVGLIHQSAKDYLLRETPDSNPKLEAFRIKKEVGNLKIAARCLDYLQDGALRDGKVDLKVNIAHLKAFPLLSYAALHWHEHARSLNRSENIFDLSLPFYQTKSQIRESWWRTYWAAMTPEEEPDVPDSFTLLHVASFFGILPLAENLLLKQGWINTLMGSFYLNKKNGDGYTALTLAARAGHKAVVQLLLEKGADVEAKGRRKWFTFIPWKALQFAAFHGHEAIVQLLLENGADAKTKTEDGRMVLQLAAQGGHEAVVQLLLDEGEDVETKNEDGYRALQFAAQDGHEAVVRLLLENGADIEAKTEERETALQLAAFHGHEAVVRVLLEMGADVEAGTEIGVTALHIAAQRGHEAVVRLLLDKGADAEVQTENGDTALQLAALWSHKSVVQLLS
jgi:ankyrin repeat protein